jgi:hypothetical protein
MNRLSKKEIHKKQPKQLRTILCDNDTEYHSQSQGTPESDYFACLPRCQL